MIVPSRDTDPLADVVLAVSAFRSNAEVLALLERLFQPGIPTFGAVLVVESLGDGSLGAAIRSRGWTVDYVNSEQNLGSAGNLALRLRRASAKQANWCYAINHDGELDLETVRAMVRDGRSGERIGAVHPLRLRPNRGHSIEAPRSNFLPLSSFRLHREATGKDLEEVAWGSSNGTLYALAPLRQGLSVWADLWMGWEDLAYGWLLWKNGWLQIRSSRAKFVDRYEHRAVNLLGRSMFIHDKPPWISYYTTRNLVLFVRRSGAGRRGWAVALWRLAQEAILAVLFKDHKANRVKLLIRGFRDGMRGMTGMVMSPDRSK